MQKVLGRQYTVGRRELYCINCGQKIKRYWSDNNESDEQQIKVNKFHIVQTLENARKIDEELFNDYTVIAVEYYMRRDYDSFNYWFDRAGSTLHEKHRLEKDILKLEGENYDTGKKM